MTKKARKAPAARKGVSQAEFGRHVDLSQQRVAQMLAAGTISAMPNGAIDREAARILYIRALRRSPGSEEARRVAAARARHIEIQNAKQLGQLIEIEDVQACIAEIINELSIALAGVAAASTRDVELRAVIQANLDSAISRCKTRLGGMVEAAISGRPLHQAESDEDEG